MKDPKNEVGSPKHKLRPLTKGFLMEFFSWYALFPQCYVMLLRDLLPLPPSQASRVGLF